MMNEYCVLLTTCADQASARQLVETLVEEKLIACANLLPQIQSIYRWQGKIETDSEVLVLMKTHRALYVAIENRLKELHDYDVPELLMLKIEAGLPAYLNWLDESVGMS